MSRILGLRAENFKKLTVVNITPDGNVIKITGKNGHGKTSVLDAIEAAIEGAKHIPRKPIRTGSKDAMITLVIGDEKTDLIVKRRFTEGGGTTLTVETANGARKEKPQNILNALIGALSFDPADFSRRPAAEQSDMLRKLVKLEIDPDELDGLNKRDFDERTVINREAAALRAQADGIVVADNLPAERIDTKAILDELMAVGDFNAAIDKEMRRRARQQADAKRTEATRLRNQAAALDAEADKMDIETLSIDKTLQELPPYEERKDPGAIRTRLQEAETDNNGIEQRTRKAKLIADADAKESLAKQLTDAIDARKKVKADAIAAVKMPIEGLSFADGGVLYKGEPFEQCSEAEKIRVGMAIAMAANPTLRVIRIREGSALDEDSMKIVADMAKAGDFQVWCEIVSNDGNVGFVMEDGHVKGHEPPPATAAEETAQVDAPMRRAAREI